MTVKKWEDPKYDEYGYTQWHWLVRYRENFKLGERCQIGNFVLIDAYKGVEIGNNAKIGHGAKILSYSSIDGYGNKVVIMENACVGANSVVMPGVKIGKNSIVGALSFVPKETIIPDNEIWFGIPAKFVKKINQQNK